MSTDPYRPVLSVDGQQAQLLEHLRAAGGGPMSFEELRSLGIENPAVLCYELDLVGMPIARVYRYDEPGHVVPVGVRLEATSEATETREHVAPRIKQTATAAMPRWHGLLPAYGARVGARLRSARPARLIAAPSQRGAPAAVIALMVVVAAVAALALTNQSGRPSGSAAARANADRFLSRAAASGGRRPSRPVGRSVKPVRAAAAAASGDHTGGASRTTADGAGAPSSGAQTASQQAPAAVAPRSAAQLQAQGHQLVNDGNYGAAIDDLRAALAASGQSSTSCRIPGSEACLTYAYALYDLGHALRLDGETAAAVGVLSERMQIDNQRATVRNELDLAQATADAGGAAAPAPRILRKGNGGTPATGKARGGRRPPAHSPASAPST